LEQNSYIIINQTQNIKDIEKCAGLMSTSEPWITLKRDYKKSFDTLSDKNKELYIATINNKIVGFILLLMNGGFKGYIQSICTHPDWRKTGIGSQLLDFAEKRIFKETPNVFMCVSSFNNIAREFYLKKGYETIGELKNYIINKHSEFLLRKTTGCLSDFN
jgi:ribosomal protein S18 acetylase RimI-like enzyme